MELIEPVTLISRREEIIDFFNEIISVKSRVTVQKEIDENFFHYSQYVIFDLTSFSGDFVFLQKDLLKFYNYKIIFIVTSSLESEIANAFLDTCLFVLPFPCSCELAKSFLNIFLIKKEMLKNDKENFITEKKSLVSEVLLGDSPLMYNLRSKIVEASKMDYPILLLGETGTGKTTAARVIHQMSKRKDNKFVEYNSSNLKDELADSVLFGTEEGAYTDAKENYGLIKKADGGTLFLDEIGLISPVIQSKFLSIFDNGEYYRVGGTSKKKVDVKYIFATNEDIALKRLNNEFRDDFFYRIQACSIEFPPLREHKEDIRLLARTIAQKEGKIPTENLLRKLEDYSWPGNIRQLKNCILVGCKISNTELLDSKDVNIY